MMLSLSQVAKATGRSKSVISNALKIGKLSYHGKDGSGQYSIDMAEALRVFPPKNKQLQSHRPVSESLIKEHLEQERKQSSLMIAQLIRDRDEWKNQAIALTALLESQKLIGSEKTNPKGSIIKRAIAKLDKKQ